MSHKMSKSHLEHFVVHSILVLVLGSCNSEVAVTPTDNIWGVGILPTASPPTQVSTSTPSLIHIASSTVLPTQAPTITNPMELPEPTPAPAVVEFWDDSYSFQMTSEAVGWGTTWLKGENWIEAILRTTDGGLNWQDVSPTIIDDLNQDLEDFFILDDNHAWAITESPADEFEHDLIVWSTQNGGHSWWKQASWHFSKRQEAVSVSFENAQHGLVRVTMDVAAGTLYIQPFKTSDGGLHWQKLSPTTEANFPSVPAGLPPPPDVPDLSFMDCLEELQTFFSAQEGIFQILCWRGLFIYHTYDGGQTWNVPVYREFPISLIDFVDIDNGWYVAYVETNPPNRAFYVTHDAGKTSSEIMPVINNGTTYDIPGDTAEAIAHFDFIDLKTGFAVFDGGDNSVILKTTDGGYTWNAWVPHLLPAR
jgi:photosystem II stability/assembly factor-like uncharacterized protein